MKQRKLITLDKRLTQDILFIMPLGLSIIYLNLIEPYMKWKYNIIDTASSIDRISIFLFLFQFMYMTLCTSSLEQVEKAYKTKIKEIDFKKIKKIYDFRIDFQYYSTFIIYISGYIRAFSLIKIHDNVNYNSIILLLAVLSGLFLYISVNSIRRKIDKLIIDNIDRFY